MYANALRAGALNDERVGRKVSAYFVPTLFNNNDPTRKPDDPNLKLWKEVTRQKPLQGQGIWVISPDGQVLGGMSAEVDGHPSDKVGNGPGAPWRSNSKFTAAVLELLDKTLAEFGAVQPRNAKATPLAYRGAGVRPDGGIRPIVLNRADNGLAFSIFLNKEAFNDFGPPKNLVGTRWYLPERTAREFGPVLSPYADTRFRPQPKDVVLAELTGIVEAVNRQSLTLRFSGRWKVDWVHDDHEHSLGESVADGFGDFDWENNTLTSLLFVFDGHYSYSTPKGPTRTQHSSAVVRWRLLGDAE